MTRFARLEMFRDGTRDGTNGNCGGNGDVDGFQAAIDSSYPANPTIVKPRFVLISLSLSFNQLCLT